MTSKTLLGRLALTGCALMAATQMSRAQTPLYQWTFDGVTGTNAPSITAGGGDLTNTIGAGNFNGVGLTGGASDFAYLGAAQADGVRSSTNLSGLGISGMGTNGALTVTFWMNPSLAYSGQQASSRILMFGNAIGYDESAGNASPGFSLALNGNTGLQYNINNGSQPAQAGVFSPYAANQWVFVAVEYDGLGTPTSSTALGTAIGNSTGNYAIFTGTTTASIGAPIMENLVRNGTSVSPGPMTNTASMVLLIGNRNSGGRGFVGMIDNINIYTNLLTSSQLETLRISSFATTFTAGAVASAPNPLVPGVTVYLFSGVFGGTGPYTYQWQADGGTGTFTNIPGATAASFTNTTSILGSLQYQVVVTDSTTATATSSPVVENVIIKQGGTLTVSSNAPVPGSTDAYQLNEATTATRNSGGLNYYTDNGNNNGLWMGNTFTTGNNSKGYSINSVAIDLAGTGNPNGLTATNIIYSVYLYSISADGTTAQTLAIVTNITAGAAIPFYPSWVTMSFAPITLNSNSTYGYGFGRGGIGAQANVYLGMATSDATQDWYTGGQIAGFRATGGAVVYGNNPSVQDGTFDVGLIPLGVPFILSAVIATPNPSYALSPVKLACAPVTPGTYTYSWLTDDGTGANPPNLINISGANATNLTVIPKDLNPGGADYPTNFYFVAVRTADSQSVTSSAVTLTVRAASAPFFTATPALTNLFTFVGSSVQYSFTELGTLPITNQWQFDNGLGGGFVSLTARTNTTLLLTNLQTTSSGNYLLAATNLIGNTSSLSVTPITLTVQAPPVSPVPGQTNSFMAFTNNPWAYWRLNETNDPAAPGAPIYQAYDYSGHGFYPTYGTAVTVNNPGPSSLTPGFPGFGTNQLAAGTAFGTLNSYLTVPALNLAGNSNITFMAWINPASQAASAGLLFNRGGPDGACGFGFGNISDHLGYTWNNNNANTYNWDSGLVVAEGQWNFVAYVITPTSATLYLANLSGGTTNFSQAVNAIAHIPETFAGGNIRLGGDANNITRNFNGLITEASLFTNAMSTAQIQKYFLAGIGAAGLVPTVNVTVSPSDATSGAGVYSGQNVLLNANLNGTGPLTNQWQASLNGGTTWTNIPGATNSLFVASPLYVGTVNYQFSSSNAIGSASSAPVAVLYNALPATPPGLWTVNFEYTNNIGGPNQIPNGGLGSYIGRGVLGDGMFWNKVPTILAGTTANYNSVSSTNTTSLADNGASNLGVNCLFNNGGAYNAIGTLASSYDPMNLTEQWFRGYGEGFPNQFGYSLQLSSVPDGTYNVACYGGSGYTTQGSQNRGTQFIVVGANGNQTNVTACPSPVTSLQQGVNFVVFTNVHSTGGRLNISVSTNNAAEPTENWGAASAVQLQLVNYDPPTAAFAGAPLTGPAALTVTFTNNSNGATNWFWDFGDGSTLSTGSRTNVNHTYTSVGTYTVILNATGPLGSNALTNTAYITVTVPPLPVPGFAASRTNIFASQTVVFTNLSTGNITNSAWDFGNGNVANTSGAGVTNNVSNIYSNAGSYTVSLTVTGNGGSSNLTQTAYIVVSPKPVMGKPMLSGNSLILSGSNGLPGVQYRILSSTNVAQALATWKPVWTNVFAADGSYIYTNTPLTNSASFFQLVSP